MMKKIIIALTLLLPFGIRCDQPTPEQQQESRAKARAIWDNMSQENREEAYINIYRESYQLRQTFPELSSENVKLIASEKVMQWQDEQSQRQAECRQQQEEYEIIKCLEIVVIHNPGLDDEEVIRIIKQATPEQRQEWLDAYNTKEQRRNAAQQKVWEEQRTTRWEKMRQQQDVMNQIIMALVQNPTLTYQEAHDMVAQATPAQQQEWLDAHKQKEQEQWEKQREKQSRQWNNARTKAQLIAIAAAAVCVGCVAYCATQAAKYALRNLGLLL